MNNQAGSFVQTAIATALANVHNSGCWPPASDDRGLKDAALAISDNSSNKDEHSKKIVVLPVLGAPEHLGLGFIL